jgi:hypothetical protein
VGDVSTPEERRFDRFRFDFRWNPVYVQKKQATGLRSDCLSEASISLLTISCYFSVRGFCLCKASIRSTNELFCRADTQNAMIQHLHLVAFLSNRAVTRQLAMSARIESPSDQYYRGRLFYEFSLWD